MGRHGDETQALGAELSELRARAALFEVAARYDDLLQRGAFEHFATTLAGYLPLGRLVVVVPDGEEQILYAASVGDSASPLPPFGARFPLPEAENRRIVMEGGLRICRDTRLGDALDRSIARFGYLSYAALPIRDLASEGDPPPIVAKLIVCFAEVDQAAEASLALLEASAALFGARFARSLARARDRRLAMILETSGDAMLAWNHAGQIADVNAAACRLTGLMRSELMGRRIGDVVEGVAVGKLTGPLRTRLCARTPNGSAEWVPVSVTITQLQDDPVVAAHLLARDISQRVAAERESTEHLARTRALEQEHRTLLDNAPLVIFRLEPETGDVLYVNRYAEILFGISPEHAREHPGCLRAAHADADAARSFGHALERARRGLPFEPYEAHLLKPGGGEITARGCIYAIRAQDRVVAMEGVLADISAEHAARTQLVQTDRLSTLGRLAAGVAHEINNPAAFLMLGLDHLSRMLSGPGTPASADDRSEILKLLEQLADSVQRIATIVRDLRLFAGPAKARVGAPPVATDLHRAVQSALTLTRSQLSERARLSVDLEPVPPVPLEEGRLAQVIVNLLVNAAQAIPKDSGREHRIALVTRAEGDRVQLEVADTGAGIAREDLARIWAPFFTTKELGTGLGLAISRDIVERAGGTIEVISPAFDEPGVGAVGSRFIVSLAPAASDAARAIPTTRTEPSAPPQPRGPRPPAARKRILIVEDERAFASALAQELGEHHDVQLAHGGSQAIDALRERAFDVILCDVRMPEGSGEAVYTAASALSPAYKTSFIFMTGLGWGTDLARLHDLYRCPVLEKPFSLDRLLRTIDALG